MALFLGRDLTIIMGLSDKPHLKPILLSLRTLVRTGNYHNDIQLLDHEERDG